MTCSSNALIVFAKTPKAGKVKTRLSPRLSPAEAARLYEAFLQDSLAKYVGLDVAIRLYVAPPVNGFPRKLISEQVQIRQQQGRGLGARMANAFEETLAAGFEKCVIIGTDHPTLPVAYVRSAFQRLTDPQGIVIGPSDDGGYYLLGKTQALPQLFSGMTYSHPDVFTETVARARQHGIEVDLLPEWYDVDTPDDLDRMLADLRDSGVRAPRTRQISSDMGLI